MQQMILTTDIVANVTGQTLYKAGEPVQVYVVNDYKLVIFDDGTQYDFGEGSEDLFYQLFSQSLIDA